MSKTTTITSQVVAQGSYGIYRTDAHGRQIGSVIRVWHLQIGGRLVGTYRTRREAREAARG